MHNSVPHDALHQLQTLLGHTAVLWYSYSSLDLPGISSGDERKLSSDVVFEKYQVVAIKMVLKSG